MTPSTLTTPEQCTLRIAGMSCAACQVHVERALRQTPGVDEASVNLMTNSARVVFHPAVASLKTMIENVREAGYDAAPQTENASDSEENDAAREETLKYKAIAVLAGGALLMLAGMHVASQWVGASLLHSFMLVITAAGMVWGGGIIYRRAWQAAIHRSTNMNTLVALGTGAAFLYSVAAAFFAPAFLRHGLKPDVYYDAVLLILGFLLLGQWLDARAKRRTRRALEALMKLQPVTARVLRGGLEIEIPVEEVAPGAMLVVRPGERIPVDGKITTGSTTVDESLITGESTPVLRRAGDRVLGGSLNYDGAFEYEATSIGADSVLGQMVRLMEQAQSSKAPMQQLADRVSAVFVPSVLGIAAVTFGIWLWLGGDASRAIAVAIAVLVIACPCAMGLAVPAALTVAIGRGAQMGILFKDGERLERLARIDTVVLDKTGTVTSGKPSVVSVEATEGVSETDLLALAAAVEQRSEHPLAHAVVEEARRRGITVANAADVTITPGEGIEGLVDGRRIQIGNARFVRMARTPSDGSASGVTRIFIASEGQYLGAIAARDTLREGAREAVAGLQKLSIQVSLLTGDSHAAADAIARDLGIDKVEAELLPGEKLAAIRKLQAEGRRVAMVGDGINDAAALAQADAGLAMGTGTDLAAEAGDAVLLRGDPAQILEALLLARAALRVMRQNLVWAFGYNVLGIPIAAGVLYPAFGILLNPALAAAAMALSSVSVLSNSLRLRSFQPR